MSARMPMDSGRPTRVAIVVSHPIQHFCPQYASWSSVPGVELLVLFASRQGLEPYFDRQFGQTVQWSGLDLSFPHVFLKGAEGRRVSSDVDAPDLPQHLNDFKPHLVIVYGYSQALARHATSWARHAGVLVAMISDSESRSTRSFLRRIVKAVVVPRLLARASFFLSVGDANEAYLRGYGVKDTRLIRCPFPIDVRAFQGWLRKSQAVRAEVRAAHNIGLNQHVVLNVGKFVPGKRQADLVDIAVRCQGAIVVVLAGTGPMESALRQRAMAAPPGSVVFAGFVPPADLGRYYLAADLYVQPSEVDAHSLSVSEAVYCGLPVVVSDKCGSFGPSDDVRNGLNGFVFPLASIDQLESAVLRIARSEDLRTAMSAVSSEIGTEAQALAHGKALTQMLRLARHDQ
jgi:glycosyltransferase involved in cell wall biosynthesis